MRKIRKGDEVIVITGKDKGKRGTVLRVQNDKLVVEGVNIAKKHQKPNPARSVAGGIVEKTMPVDASNVAIFNPKSQEADYVTFKVLEDSGRKVRVFKSNGEIIGA